MATNPVQPHRPFLDNYKTYVESGFLVVALDGVKPHPVCQSSPGGMSEAREWVKELPPESNLGVQIPEGIVVITLDSTAAGGSSLKEACEANNVCLPKTLCSYTSRNGLQAWFYGTSDPQCRPLPGVYIHSFPRPIPVPPSVGANGAQFRWASAHPVAPLPEGLLSALSVRPRDRHHQPTFVDSLHAPAIPWGAAVSRLQATLGATTH